MLAPLDGARGDDVTVVWARAVTNKRTRNHIDDLRGISRLAIEATRGVTDLVEAMHRTIGSGPVLLGRPLRVPMRMMTSVVYGSIRGVTRWVGDGIDFAFAQLAPLVSESSPGPERELALAVLNGVLGDHLSETGNPLEIQMQLRQGYRPLELQRQALRERFPEASNKVLLLVHGCCGTDRQWLRLAHDHGAAIAHDLGYTPLYVFYNTGLHISTNGQAFGALLERLVAEWPVAIDELTIIGHSMGGLVARSACHYGELEGHAWRPKLCKLVCLGSPHQGAALERGGNLVDLLLGVSRYSAPFARLGKIRSAGVTDMRFGCVLHEDWEGHDRFAYRPDPRHGLRLPDGVECYAIAATTAPGPRPDLPGDGLVSVDSALGRHRKPELALAFPESHQFIGFGMGHLDLLHRPEVYGALRSWLA
jgi:pimeloyl-ACP methyl ester carboxylesterase